MLPHVRHNISRKQKIVKRIGWFIRFAGIMVSLIVFPIILSQMFAHSLNPSEAKDEIKLYLITKITYQYSFDLANVPEDMRFKDTRPGETYFNSLDELRVDNVVVKRPIFASSRRGGSTTLAKAAVNGTEHYFIIRQQHYSKSKTYEVPAIRWRIPIY